MYCHLFGMHNTFTNLLTLFVNDRLYLEISWENPNLFKKKITTAYNYHRPLVFFLVP